MNNALNRALNAPTPQTEPLDDRQVPNSAGGHVYKLDPWKRFDRFLILGTEGGTYYANERTHTLDNVAVVDEVLGLDPTRAVARATMVSNRGLAPRNDQALYVIAKAMATGDTATRYAAGESLPFVARTGTHLFTWQQFYAAMNGGWGRQARKAVQGFYNMDVRRLALQAVKYRQRDGWTHRDALRLAHPKTDDPTRRAVFEFMVSGKLIAGAPDILHAYVVANGPEVTPTQAAALVARYNLPWEAIQSQHVNHPQVLAELAKNMPVGATVRQVSRFARAGMLEVLSETEQLISARLTDKEKVATSRLHPLQALEAMIVHRSGGQVGLSRGATYTPNQAVLAALSDAFGHAFETVDPAGKRMYLAVDVSGSMNNWHVGSQILTAREAAAALALITAKTEPWTHCAAFTGWMEPFEVGRLDTFADVVEKTSRMRFGATDCAAPMIDATERGLKVDCFVVYTDNETWAGEMHPVEALRRYRKSSGIDARLVVVGMTSTGFTIADPDDAGTLDVVGFSTETPALISAFARGDLG